MAGTPATPRATSTCQTASLSVKITTARHTTYLPLLQPARPVARFRRCPARHLGLVCLGVLLCKAGADLLVRLEVRLLAILVAVGGAVALDALFQGLVAFAALRTCGGRWLIWGLLRTGSKPAVGSVPVLEPALASDGSAMAVELSGERGLHSCTPGLGVADFDASLGLDGLARNHAVSVLVSRRRMSNRTAQHHITTAAQSRQTNR
jgi:hypothetical protein